MRPLVFFSIAAANRFIHSCWASLSVAVLIFITMVFSWTLSCAAAVLQSAALPARRTQDQREHPRAGDEARPRRSHRFRHRFHSFVRRRAAFSILRMVPKALQLYRMMREPGRPENPPPAPGTFRRAEPIRARLCRATVGR
jgi:hypothetical protein